MVDQLLLRGEFFTAYTPYQPEISQGTLQALFEWQTFVCLLTGLDVSNASMYDGATATAEAVLMAARATGRRKIVVSAAVHPEYRKVLATYLALDARRDRDRAVRRGRPHRPRGARDGGGRRTRAAVIVGYPNFLGVVDALPEAAAIAKRAGALTVAVTAEAVALGLLQAPGALGADVAVGTLQSFGNPSSFGGPAPGLLRDPRAVPPPDAGPRLRRDRRQARPARLRAHPLHPRAAHPPREGDLEHLHQRGAGRARRDHPPVAARQEGARASWRASTSPAAGMLQDALGRAGIGRCSPAPTFNEAAFDVGRRRGGRGAAREAGIVAGVPLARWYPDAPEAKGALLSVATELHTPELIELFAQAVKG